ncbi:hypothetical protein R1flu_026047 [Riccia fluitans]|uniref:NAD-dependent epimerase/dehydratase domain-containing protein n=1 Tax=Riccia fluitans TaxID=41844 RepID=A0ABD1XEU6_9MARC
MRKITSGEDQLSFHPLPKRPGERLSIHVMNTAQSPGPPEFCYRGILRMLTSEQLLRLTTFQYSHVRPWAVPDRVIRCRAGGYVASYLVKCLLKKGYRVRGTVRDPANSTKTKHLRDLPGAEERLELVGADLLVEGSFDAAVEGCVGVFHTASPVVFPKVDPYVEMVEPAIKGTINVLKSCVKAGVKKVVLTSSSSAFRMRPDYTADVPLDETSWSSVEFCKKVQLWYALAKTMAEEAAWDFAKETGLNMVSVLPTYIIGEIVPPELSTTSQDVLGLFNGKAGNFAKFGRMGYVHVDDVATAHILVYEHPEAEGRYIVSGVTLENYEMAEMLAKRYPQYVVPKIEPGAGMPYYNIDVSKLAKLGLDKYKPIEEAFDDVVESFKQKGVCELQNSLGQPILQSRKHGICLKLTTGQI